MVVSGGYDNKVEQGVIKVWALTGEASAECVATLEGHTHAVCGVAVGPDFVASQALEHLECGLQPLFPGRPPPLPDSQRMVPGGTVS
jgi:hypothetical protein